MLVFFPQRGQIRKPFSFVFMVYLRGNRCGPFVVFTDEGEPYETLYRRPLLQLALLAERTGFEPMYTGVKVPCLNRLAIPLCCRSFPAVIERKDGDHAAFAVVTGAGVEPVQA